MHNYPSVSFESEDEESNKRNLNLLETELKESNPDTVKIKELMRRTIQQRRKWILEGAHTIQTICTKYPVLKMSSYVSQYVVNRFSNYYMQQYFSSVWSLT